MHIEKEDIPAGVIYAMAGDTLEALRSQVSDITSQSEALFAQAEEEDRDLT